MSKIQNYENILSDVDILDILNLSEVQNAKKNIDKIQEGSIYFSISLTPSIKNSIYEKLGLNLFQFDSIPMRWLKGDTRPHIDRGISSFDNTYLIYLTDNQGKFVIENNSYPISKGTAYVFHEGLYHETINTGIEPRLLLGPMSEKGFAVGSVISRPGGNTIYFRQTSDIQYSLDDQVSWINVGNNYPLNIVNSDTTLGYLNIEFVGDITFNNSSPGGVFKYFICGSSYLQFGSSSLNNDGTRPKITIDGVLNYPGLIENGYSSLAGQSNIRVYNLEVLATNGSTLINDAGWIGKSYFAKNANSNYVVNCSSDGPIIDAGGGIIGGYSGESGSLYISGCSSSGNMGQYSGGIIGFNAGQNAGNVTCEFCWSTGNIGTDSGGIFGYEAGYSEGHTYATKCYSTGNIGTNGGGIYGSLAGTYTGRNYATGCYSLGNIDQDAGGIFGKAAGSDGGTCVVTNCYSNGNIFTSGNGIYGTNKQSGATLANCYIGNGSWSSTSANSQLTGYPVSPNIVGTSWVSTVTNQPYEINGMGYTPYSTSMISNTSTMIQTTSLSIGPSGTSSAAIVSGKSYTILQKSGGHSSSYGTISIDSTTGVITTTTGTKPGTYVLYIRNTGSYNITEFRLTITGKSKKKKKKNVRILFNNTMGMTTIIKCKKCKPVTFEWCN